MAAGSNGGGITSSSGGGLEQSSGSAPGQQAMFDLFPERLRAFGGFVQALAQYKLADAQEQLIRRRRTRKRPARRS